METLPDLTHLDLHDNRLSGQVPAHLSNLPNLVYINLRDNLFAGDIPQALIAHLWDLGLLSASAGEDLIFGTAKGVEIGIDVLDTTIEGASGGIEAGLCIATLFLACP